MEKLVLFCPGYINLYTNLMKYIEKDGIKDNGCLVYINIHTNSEGGRPWAPRAKH